MRFSIKALGLSLAALLSLAACTPYTAAQRAAPEGPLPGAYTLYEAGGEKLPARWWSAFGSGELDRLIDTALAGDFSIQTARARLRAVEAQALAADASRVPEISVRAGGAGERHRRNDRSAASESYSLSLAAAYELDWWGRLAAERQAARLDAVAAADDVRAAAMTVSGEVARNWIGLIAQKARRRLLEAQLATSRTYLELVRLRFSKGLASALDVYQQQQVVEQVRAELPLLAETEARLGSALALLLGHAGRGRAGRVRHRPSGCCPRRSPGRDSGRSSGQPSRHSGCRRAPGRRRLADRRGPGQPAAGPDPVRIGRFFSGVRLRSAAGRLALGSGRQPGRPGLRR